jgi:type IV pilus assembly protein PilO
MKNILDKFLKLPLLHRGILGLAAVVGFVLLLNLYLVGPVAMQAAELEDKFTDLEYNLSRERSAAKKLPAVEQEVASLDQKLRRILLELPDQKEIDAFLRSISVLAVDTGLEVVKFSPSAEVPREFFFELPVQIQLSGTFHQLITFFDELSRLSGIVNIKEIAIKTIRTQGEKVLISVACKATTYRYDESSRPVGEVIGRK